MALHRHSTAVPVRSDRVRTTRTVSLTTALRAVGPFLPEHVIAASPLDRLLHRATIVVTEGESFRMREAPSRKGSIMVCRGHRGTFGVQDAQRWGEQARPAELRQRGRVQYRGEFACGQPRRSCQLADTPALPLHRRVHRREPAHGNLHRTDRRGQPPHPPAPSRTDHRCAAACSSTAAHMGST